MGVVSLHRPATVSGIGVVGARLASPAPGREPWRPLVIGEELDGRALEASPLRDAPGAEVLSWPRGFGPVAQALLVRERLREMGADVIVPNDLPHGFVAGALDHHRGVRVAGWFHAAHYDGDELAERCAPCADAWGAVSDGARRRILGLSRERRFEIAPGGLVCHAGVAIPARAPALPGVPPLRLLFAGRLERQVKRVMDLAVLTDELASHGAAFRLTIAGEGPARSSLEAALSRHAERVRFEGAIHPADMPRLIGACHVLLLLSESEGMPTIVMEAMAGGRVCAITRGCGGATELIRDADTGVVVETGDMRTLAARLADLAARPLALRDIARRARLLARRACGDEAASAALTALIERARAAPSRAGTGDDAHVEAHWARILRALEAIGPCSPESLRTLARAWLSEIESNLAPGSGRIPLTLPGVPSPAERLFVAAMERLAREGVRTVALYGAGAHTRRIARAVARFCGTGARPLVGVILDDRAGAPDGPPDVLLGLPVVRPGESGGSRFDAIVVSSDEHEREMLGRARGFAPRVPVVGLYQPASERIGGASAA